MKKLILKLTENKYSPIEIARGKIGFLAFFLIDVAALYVQDLYKIINGIQETFAEDLYHISKKEKKIAIGSLYGPDEIVLVQSNFLALLKQWEQVMREKPETVVIAQTENGDFEIKY